MKVLDGRTLLAESGLDHFKAGSTFGALSAEAIRCLLTHGRILSLDDGEDLFKPGDPGDSFYVVLEGELDYFRERDNAEVLIRTIPFGEQFGYVSMVGLLDRIGIGRARGPVSVLLEINSDLFYELHLDFPFDFGILLLNLSRDMARTIRKITTHFVETSIGPSVG